MEIFWGSFSFTEDIVEPVITGAIGTFPMRITKKKVKLTIYSKKVQS